MTSGIQHWILLHKINVRWNASCARYQCMINFARKLRISALSWCQLLFKAKVLWKMKIRRIERTLHFGVRHSLSFHRFWTMQESVVQGFLPFLKALETFFIPWKNSDSLFPCGLKYDGFLHQSDYLRRLNWSFSQFLDYKR